jgi:hypothetical protein
MKPVITGLGLITPFGSSTFSFWEGLQGKKKALYKRKRIPTPQGEKELGIFSATTEGIDEYLPVRARRRMELFTQKGIWACHLALKDAGIDAPANKRIGIVFGSAYGCANASFAFQDSVIEYGDACPSPTHFVNSVHNTPVSQMSLSLNIQGPCATVSCFEMTTASVIQTAWDFLAMDMADVVVAAIGEEDGEIRQYATASFETNTSDNLREPLEAFVCFVLEKNTQKSGYGSLCDIVLSSDQQKEKEIIKTLSGIITSDTSVKKTPNTQPPVFNYTSAYGYMPSRDALALAAAALSLREGVLPCGSLALAHDAILGCMNCTGSFSSLITIQKIP